MKDYTLPGARKNANPTMPEDRWLEDYDTCSIPHCVRPRSEEVSIHLCERHIEKAWAAHMILNGANVPALQPETRDVRSQDAPGTVYIVRVGDLIKIGWSSDFANRSYNLKADAILYYTSGTRELETEFHQRCKKHLAKGNEWFHDNPSMRKIINSIQQERIDSQKATPRVV